MFSKGRGFTRDFINVLCRDWGDEETGFVQIIPAHYDAPIAAGQKSVRVHRPARDRRARIRRPGRGTAGGRHEAAQTGERRAREGWTWIVALQCTKTHPYKIR